MNRLTVLASLALVACSGRETELSPPTRTTATQEAALVTAFATGSRIIPVDNTSQNSGTLRAFGLVDRLLRANVPVHRVALTGKPVNAIDFSATVNSARTGLPLGTVDYRAGPFIIAAADVTPAVQTIITTYVADLITNVHVATAPFNADVRRTLIAAPRIAVLRDGNENIAYQYLNAANILDSAGNTWSNASPGALTLAGAAGANGGAFDGALFTGGQPAFDQLTSMHYSTPASNEVVREVRGWLSASPNTHAYMQCEAIIAFENNVNGRFLSDAGMLNDDSSAANPDTTLVPDSLFAQFDGNFTVDTGSVQSLGLLPGSQLYNNSSILMAQTGATTGTNMIWLTGHIDGDLNKGKISYLVGHGYSTATPISTNPQTNGVRLFLNSLYETPGLGASDQPVITVTKIAPAAVSSTNFVFTLNYANAGPGTVFNASLTDVLPAGTSFVSATGGGVNAAGTVTWTLGNLTAGTSGSVTVTVTAPEGTYQNRATLTYRLGLTNKSVQSNQTTTVVDRTQPNTTLTATPPALSASNGANFTFTSNEATATFECSLDGAAFAACTSPRAFTGLSDGSHTFQVRAVDAAGNVDATPASFTWIIDTTAPNTTITAAPPAASSSTSANFTFTSTEAGTFECSLDGAMFAACSSPASLTGLSDGSHTFQVRARDTAGNADPTPASHTWTIDATPPNTTFTATPAAVSTSPNASFSFSSTEAGTFECSLDGAAFAACTSPAALTGLSDGSHTFQARARDTLGNVDPTPASFTWTVDTAAPDTTITSGPPAVTNATTASLTFTSTEAGTFECSVDGAAFAACSSPLNLTGLAEGSHTVRVRAIDGAGNVDGSPASRTWLVDTTAPTTTITVAPPAQSASNSATFEFTSGEFGATFECSLDGAAFTACSSPLVLSSLADGSHTLLVRARDAAGNVDATPASHTWTVDTVAPDTTIVSGPSGTVNSATATFVVSSEASATLECSLDGAAFAACTSPVTLSMLSDGPHTFSVRAIDGTGNVDPTPATRTWTVDTQAPDTAIATGPTGAVSSSTAAFTFTSTEAMATFECSLDGAAFAACPAATTLTGLSDGSHTLEVRAVDAGGNRDASPASRTWLVDTQQPNTTLSGAPTGTTNDSTATLTFGSNETGVTFECSLDGAAFAPCTSPVSLTALNDGPHTFSVRAIDAAGNVDATPATATWTVDAAVPDTTITSGPTGNVSVSDATFDFTSTKPSSTFECSLDGAAFAACTGPTTLTGLSDGAHTFSVRAIDAVGNVDPTPATRAWTVDTAAPDTTITVRPVALSNDTSADFEFTSPETGATFECSLDGAAWTSCTSPFTTTGTLSDGVHVLLVRARDAAGNFDATPASASWEVDTTAPPAPIFTEPVADATTGALPRFGGFAEPGATVTVTSNGMTVCTAVAGDDGRWSCGASTPLTMGMQSVTATATDGAGNTSMPSVPRPFNVDSSRPDTAIVTGPAQPTNVARADFTVSSDVSGATFECSLDGAAFTACPASPSFVVTEGSHSLVVRAVANGATDASPATYSWTLDLTAPSAPVLTSPTANGTTSSTPTFAGTAEPGSTVVVSLDGQPICTAITDAAGNFSCAGTAALPPGAHTANAVATDPAGNDSPPSTDVPFTVGSGTLDTAIIAGPSGTVSSTTANFAFTSTVVGATFECSLDGAAFMPCTTPVTFSGLAAGSHTLQVRAVDGANVDTTPASRTWIIDTAAPTAPVVATPAHQSTVRTRTPRYSGTAEAGSTVVVSVDDREVCTAVADMNGAWECTGTSPLADGDHHVAAVATDAAGNVSAQSNVNRFEVDIPAMVVAIVVPADGALTNDSTPVISGTATPGSTVSIFDNGTLLGTAVADANGAWTFTPPTPLADGAHVFTARTELDSLMSAPSDAVDLTIDTRAPVVTITLTQDSPADLPSVTFSADETPVTLTCSLDGAAFAPCASPLDVTATGVGEHRLVVRATDAAGNTGESTRTWIVTEPIVVQPPIGVRGGGCGCGTTDGASGVLAMFALLLFAGRRSRRDLPERRPRRALTFLRRGLAGALAVTVFAAAPASAQVAGFDLERIDLNPGASASLVTATGDVMRKGAWRASLVLHYERDPLVLYRLDTNERLGAVVGSRFTTHLMGAWTPLEWLEVGVQLPIVLGQGGDDLSSYGVAPPAVVGLGTPWLTGRFAFLRESAGKPLDLAVQLGLGLPFGSAAAFTNATPLAFAPRVGAGRTVLKWLRLGGELGFMVRGSPASIAGTGVGSAFTFALSGTTKGHALRGEVTFRGTAALDKASFGGELLFGGRYQLTKWVEVFALGGPGFGTLPGNPAFRIFAGVGVQPPFEPEPVKVVQRCDDSVSVEELRSKCSTLDADGDGITNGADVCPRVAGVAAAKGCPMPDTDDDGLTDDVDECQKEKGLRERKGCPIRDADGDTVEDDVDACVNEAGLVARKGCPIRDADKDGVEDEVDACVNEPGPVERKGCPLKDQDGDTVEDALDNCPTEKGEVDNAGCPKKVKQLVIITKDKLQILDKVYFATGKSQVLPRSFPLLDNVAQVLLAHPEIEVVRIEGHTDSQGVAAKNVKLSQDRADAVKAQLVKRKVPATRLKSVGYGPDKPTAPNDTPAGREQNRRVEFNIEHKE